MYTELFPLLVALLATLIYYTWQLRCPKCGRLFSVRVVNRRTVENFLLSKSVKYSYRCRNCPHHWTQIKWRSRYKRRLIDI
jgi:hypothetical protein